MTTATWFLLVGLLLLSMGLVYPRVKRLPVTLAMIYLAVGVIVGPMGLAWFHFNPLKESALLEVVTEIVVLISLFAAGVKMPVPVQFRHWNTPVRLAFVSMAVTVGLVACFAYGLLDLSLGAAVLLGAVVAPTDPVLATDVQVRHPGDNDQLRFSLTCEAGMNDGSAFPFVMLGLGLLGLHELGDFGWRWVFVDLVWATVAGVAIGVAGGCGLAHFLAYQRETKGQDGLLDDFLGLGLIGSVYGASLLIHSWGFLAVFAAAVALRQTEMKLSGEATDIPQRLQEGGLGDYGKSIRPVHNLSEASLVFKEHLERLSTVVLIILIGGTLFIDSWSWRAVGFAIFLFVVARPVSVLIGLWGTGSPQRLKNMFGWFGVRGIGSLYYLMYAIEHGVPEEVALELIHITLVVVPLSIVLHGISVKPLLRRYAGSRHRRQASPMMERR